MSVDASEVNLGKDGVTQDGGTQDAPAAGGKQPRLTSLLGPAFVAAIAYVNPGNVAANLSAGAEYGYLLLWVLI
ncbi:MAG: hypothetical protein L0J86_06320, partial [Corynebacterium sp.]|nr:hypothetical protein [Corynebacterium sp.]